MKYKLYESTPDSVVILFQRQTDEIIVDYTTSKVYTYFEDYGGVYLDIGINFETRAGGMSPGGTVPERYSGTIVYRSEE